MNRRHRKTLVAIFAKPPPANARWQAVEALITTLGGEVLQLRGSVVAFILGERRGVFHRPHPTPEAKRGQLRRIRRFLEHAGVADPLEKTNE